MSFPTRETNLRNGLNVANRHPEQGHASDQGWPFICVTSSRPCTVLHPAAVSMLFPQSCCLPQNPAFPSSLASELLTRCQVTQSLLLSSPKPFLKHKSSSFEILSPWCGLPFCITKQLGADTKALLPPARGSLFLPPCRCSCRSTQAGLARWWDMY